MNVARANEGETGQVSFIIEGAAHRARPTAQDVGIDHRGLHILVAQKLLHGANIIASLKQMRRKAMAKRVAGDALLDTSLLSRPPDGFLHPTFVSMMAHHTPGTRIDRAPARWNHILPEPLMAGGRQFPRQGIGQPDLTEALAEILRVDRTHVFQIFIFLVGRLRRPRPSAGNANRWAVPSRNKQ